MDTTGPGIFAKTIYEALSISSNTTVSPSNLTSMTEPRLFGDILILPITSFAAGVGHSNAGQITDKEALVQHLFAGSWKGDHMMVTQPSEEEKKEPLQDMEGDNPEAGDEEFPQWMDDGSSADQSGLHGGNKDHESAKEGESEEAHRTEPVKSQNNEDGKDHDDGKPASTESTEDQDTVSEEHNQLQTKTLARKSK